MARDKINRANDGVVRFTTMSFSNPRSRGLDLASVNTKKFTGTVKGSGFRAGRKPKDFKRP